jgi:membrane protease YdiL (CAAX protease family)
MRSLLWFVGLIAAGLAAMAVLTYPVWVALSPHFDLAFHRVGSRLAMLVLLVGFILAARRLGVSDRASLGYGLARARFLRELAAGFGLGLVLMGLAVGLMAALGLRELRPGVDWSPGLLVSILAGGMLSGLAVALIEETFFRGAMHTAVERDSGPVLAIASTAVIYSAVHFLGRHRIAAADVHAGSGLDLLAGSLASLAQPLAIVDAFLCLAAVGVLLGLVRQVTGNIAACIGLHAAWVTVIALTRRLSRPVRDQPLSFLLSDFDGVVGWLLLGWTALSGVVLVSFYRRRASTAAGAPAARPWGGRTAR